MLASNRVMRKVSKFDGDFSLIIDTAQSWKLMDLTKEDKTAIFFNVPKDWKNSGSVERIYYAETDLGAFVLEDDTDVINVSNLTNIKTEIIKNIINILPKDTLNPNSI